MSDALGVEVTRQIQRIYGAILSTWPGTKPGTFLVDTGSGKVVLVDGNMVVPMDQDPVELF